MLTVRFAESGLAWRAASDHYHAGPYVVQRPATHQARPKHGWWAWRTATGMRSVSLGNWPTWDLAAQACEIDATRERKC